MLLSDDLCLDQLLDRAHGPTLHPGDAVAPLPGPVPSPDPPRAAQARGLRLHRGAGALCGLLRRGAPPLELGAGCLEDRLVLRLRLRQQAVGVPDGRGANLGRPARCPGGRAPG